MTTIKLNFPSFRFVTVFIICWRYRLADAFKLKAPTSNSKVFIPLIVTHQKSFCYLGMNSFSSFSCGSSFSSPKWKQAPLSSGAHFPLLTAISEPDLRVIILLQALSPPPGQCSTSICVNINYFKLVSCS